MRRTPETLDVDPDMVYHRFKELLWGEVGELAWDEKISMDIDGFHEVMKRLNKELRFYYERRKKEET